MDQARRLVSWITVEPVELLYVLMFTTSNVVRDNLFLDKVCLLDLDYSKEACYNLTHGIKTNKSISDDVQNHATDLEVIDGILVAIPAVLFSLFVGAWSDANGRKAVLIWPFVGNILSFIFYIINYYWFEDIPTLFLLLGSVAGLTGGYVVLNIGLYGYISDITSTENRTMRLSILNGVFSAGYVIGIYFFKSQNGQNFHLKAGIIYSKFLGTTLGGKLYKAFGNYYLNFGISIAFGILGLLYALFITKESIQKPPDENNPEETRRAFFDFKNVGESLQVAFKPRPGHGRLHVVLLIINFAIFMFCLNTFHYDYLLVINRYEI